MFKIFTEILKPGKTLRDRWRDFFEIIFLTLMMALVFRMFFIGVYRISSVSMAPLLIPGDFIWTSKIAYGLKLPFLNQPLGSQYPSKGDIIVFKSKDGYSSVMRVIGLPGDHILISNKKLFINEIEIESQLVNLESLLSSIEKKIFSDLKSFERLDFYSEIMDSKHYVVSYPKESTEKKFKVGPLVVAPGEVFVLSDLRDLQSERPFWKLVLLSEIDSKAKGIWFSLLWPKLDSNQANKSDIPFISWDRMRLNLF